MLLNLLFLKRLLIPNPKYGSKMCLSLLFFLNNQKKITKEKLNQK